MIQLDFRVTNEYGITFCKGHLIQTVTNVVSVLITTYSCIIMPNARITFKHNIYKLTIYAR